MLKKHLKATGIELTDAIKDYTEKKVDSLQRIIPKETEALAEIEVGKTTSHHHKGEIFRAEINLTFGREQFRAVALESDLYAAVDKMKDEIVGEVKRSRRKGIHLLKRGHQKIKNMLKGFARV